MTKKLLSLFTLASLLALLAAPVLAQQVSLGLKGGINYATLTDLPAEAKPNIFFVGGGFLVARLTNNVALMPEVLFSGKGFDVSRSGAEYLNISYLEMPVLLRFAPSMPGRRVVPFGMFGPSLAIQLDCQSYEGENSADCDEILSGQPGFNDVDYGLTAGLGSDFFLGRRGAFSVDARYTYGLNKVWDSTEWHHSVFSLMVGYRFGATPQQVALTR